MKTTEYSYENSIIRLKTYENIINRKFHTTFSFEYRFPGTDFMHLFFNRHEHPPNKKYAFIEYATCEEAEENAIKYAKLIINIMIYKWLLKS